MLLFKKKFLPAIREGKKSQTIRLWKFTHFHAGQQSYIPGAGYIRIDAVDKVDLNALTDADARPDGFPTADALRQEIESLYSEQLAQGYQAFRIVFSLLPPEEQAELVANKKKAKIRQLTGS